MKTSALKTRPYKVQLVYKCKVNRATHEETRELGNIVNAVDILLMLWMWQMAKTYYFWRSLKEFYDRINNSRFFLSQVKVWILQFPIDYINLRKIAFPVLHRFHIGVVLPGIYTVNLSLQPSSYCQVHLNNSKCETCSLHKNRKLY